MLDFIFQTQRTDNISIILQFVSALTAIILPIYVLRETNKANQKQIYLNDKIKKSNQIYKFLEDWKIKLAELSITITPHYEKYDDFTDLNYKISINSIYTNKDFKKLFAQLTNNTYSLLGGKVMTEYEDLKQETVKIITDMQKMLKKEDI